MFNMLKSQLLTTSFIYHHKTTVLYVSAPLSEKDSKHPSKDKKKKKKKSKEVEL